MPYRTSPFINGDIYHIYNRGLEKQNIFNNGHDYSNFIDTLFYYQIQNPKPKFSLYKKSNIFTVDPNKKIIDILCFCLMPNHFHLIVKQLKDGGISEYMRKAIHSFTKYRNVKYSRQGPLFQGVFKALRIESDEQLMHLSRYIHLNPFTAGLIKDLKFYPWSSYSDYTGRTNKYSIIKEDVLGFFNSAEDYQKFVLDQADYGKTLELVKHIMIEEPE